MEEVAAAILESGGPNNKMKQGDAPGVVMLCVEMHRRYSGFSAVLIPSLLAGVTGNNNGGSSGGDGETTCLPRRICLRLLTEFILHGIITDVKPIAKIVAEAAGAPSSSETNSDKEYVVTDANAVVTFAKTGGMEILGVVPRTVRLEYERLQREVEGKGEGGLVVVAADVEGSADAKKEMDLEVPFTAVLSNKLVDKATSVMESFKATTPYARAVPPPVTTTLHAHCMGAYRTLSHSYLATHRRLIKLEKRCEQDRLLQGNLSEAREKGLKDAQNLLDSLKKSVETLSDALDVDPPMLPTEEENATETTDGKGIELWTKNENDPTDEERDARLGPFDDEETRAFYCDVPDFLATKPPALLGVSPADLEKQKERNARQYGGLTGGEESELAAMEVEVVESLAHDDVMEEMEGADGEDVVMEKGGDAKGDENGKAMSVACVVLSLVDVFSRDTCLIKYLRRKQGHSSLQVDGSPRARTT